MLNELTVQIETLEPMRIAKVAVTSENPENDSMTALLDWARPQGLLDGAFRLFGYDNCEPHPNHTYTSWLTVNAETTPSGSVEIINFPGGRYAVTELHGTEQISPAWGQLAKWVKANGYEYGKTVCLEEVLDAVGGQPEHFKLYQSIE